MQEIYLDNAATTRVCPEAAAKIQQALCECYGNPSSLHRKGYEAEKMVQEATENLMKTCTTFMVAHRLSTIRNADRIVVIQKGKPVEEGSYEELMEKQGYFYKLKKIQDR